MRAENILLMILIVNGFMLTASVTMGQQTPQRPDTQQQATDDPRQGSLEQKYSYIMGYQLMMNFKGNTGMQLDYRRLLQGMRDAEAGEAFPLSAEEVQSIEEAISKVVAEHQQKLFRQEMEQNASEGEAFLAEYAQRRGVQQFESGLQMLQLEAGSGKQLETGDRIQYLFKLSLPDGEVIDGTEPSQPEPYRVGGQHLKGLMEAFPKMKVGDRWQVVIPSDLAFGKQGNRGLIGPNQTLVYEIEVVGLID